MILTERNCPVLKYLHWNDCLFNHPDFKETVERPSSKVLQEMRSNLPAGMRIARIYNMSRLGRYCFMRPYTTEYSHEILEEARVRGRKPSDLIDFYVDLEPMNAEEYKDIEESIDNTRSNTTEYSDCVMTVNREWPELVKRFSSKVDIVSSTFWEAMCSTYQTFLTESILSVLKGEQVSGTIIVPTQKGLTYMYDLKVSDVSDGNDNSIVDVDGIIIHLQDYSRVKFITADDYSFVDQSYFEAGVSVKDVTSNAVMSILLYELFKKYADVEMKVVSQLNQQTDHLEVKTFLHDVNYVDCTWYTTIIRTEGFNVRGHFRLQPCGRLRTEKKLIYINEYQKHGYKRKAKITGKE